MAIRELLLCNGYTGAGYTGNVSDIDEDYRSPDGAFISSPTDGANVAVTFDFTAPVVVTDDDVIFWLDIKYSLRVSSVENITDYELHLWIDGAPVGSSILLDNHTTSFLQYTTGKANWDLDYTVAQLEGAQMVMNIRQSGKPIDVDWDLGYVNLEFFYGKSSQLDKPLVQRKTYKHLLTR